MVHFTEFSDNGKKSLVVLLDKDQPIRSGTILPIETSITEPNVALDKSHFLSEWSLEMTQGRNSSTKVWILRSSLHGKKPNVNPEPTLGRRIIENQVRWGPLLKFNGEFTHIAGYWEWLEFVIIRNKKLLRGSGLYSAVIASLYSYDRNNDIVRAFCEAWCPSTNTLHTSSGEISLSLWDMWKLGGLPIKGRFYDETIPSCEELLRSSNEDDHLPKSCGYLFDAYHRIASQQMERQQISTHLWISFWFKGDLRYAKPPSRRPKKSSRPRSTHNPDGSLTQPRDWSDKEQELFQDLGVEEGWKERTYLAAFLSCWLCVFVFPYKNMNFLRPGVFKVASIMAEGAIFNLAVLVLSNIYHGLGQIFNTPHSTGRPDICFPIHYVYGWLAHYFGTHFKLHTPVRGPLMVDYSGEGGAKYFNSLEARKLIHQGTSIMWHASLSSRNDKVEVLEDVKGLSFSSTSFFISLRSCYLSSCHGNFMTIEAYSPCRFSRQFGFHQDVPNDLHNDAPPVSLENVFHFWRICTATLTLSKVYLPTRLLDPHDQTTRSYDKWWSHKHGRYLEEGIQLLVNSFTIPSTKPKPHKELDTKKAGKRVIEASTRPMNNLQDEEESHSSNDDRHWKRPKKVPLEDQSLTSPDAFASTSKNTGSMLKSKEVIISHPPSTDENPQRTGGKKTIPAPEVSYFCADNVISNFRRQAALSMWQSIHGKIVRTSFEHVGDLEQEMLKIFDAMAETSTNNLAPLKEFVGGYFQKVREYLGMQSSLSAYLTPQIRDSRLEEKKLHLEKALSVESRVAEEKDVLQKRLDCSVSEVAELKAKVAELEAKLKTAEAESEKLSNLVSEKEKDLDREMVVIAQIREEIGSVECAPTISASDAQTLSTLRGLLEGTRDELKELQWNP